MVAPPRSLAKILIDRDNKGDGDLQCFPKCGFEQSYDGGLIIGSVMPGREYDVHG